MSKKDVMIGGERKKAMFEQAPQTRWAIELLEKADVGDIVTYEQITEAMGCDAQRNRGYVMSAIRCLQREQDIVFGCVRTVGYKRLDSSGVAGAIEDTANRTRRMAERASRMVPALDFDELDQDERTRVLTHMGQLRFVEAVTGRKAHNRIKKAVERTKQIPSFDDAVKMLKG